jgi:hypothetical protein
VAADHTVMAVEMAYAGHEELDERGAPLIARYAEDDDAATQSMALPHREPPWIVRITALDRRMMSTDQLLARLRAGTIVSAGTLVWRGGMENWTPIARVHELANAIGSAPAASRPALLQHTPPGQTEAFQDVLALTVAALLAASVTAGSLAVGGALTPGRSAMSQHKALSAKVASRQPDTGAERRPASAAK